MDGRSGQPRTASLYGPNPPKPTLYAYDATNLKIIWQSAPGELFTTGNYSEPTVVNGLALVATDRLQAYGLRARIASPWRGGRGDARLLGQDIRGENGMKAYRRVYWTVAASVALTRGRAGIASCFPPGETSAAMKGFVSLFDGKTLKGWRGDPDALVGTRRRHHRRVGRPDQAVVLPDLEPKLREFRGAFQIPAS